MCKVRRIVKKQYTLDRSLTYREDEVEVELAHLTQVTAKAHALFYRKVRVSSIQGVGKLCHTLIQGAHVGLTRFKSTVA